MKTTQANRVLKYIKDFGSITRAEAMNDLGVANLPAVIETLRHTYGVGIDTENVHTKNRYGEKVTYARYTLADKNTESGVQLSLFQD